MRSWPAMRFLLPLALTTAMLAACDNGAGAPSRETARSSAPQQSPTAAIRKEEPAEPKSSSIAIAEQQGMAPREISDRKLMPLNEILAIARRRVPGEVIDVELDDDDDDPPEYELEILTADGRSIDMKIDARSGEIIEVEED